MHVRRVLLPLLLVVVSFTAAPARAGGTVQLELVGSRHGSALAFQQWAQTLGKAGIRNVTLRAGDESEKPTIKKQGTAQNPVYMVKGIINSRDEVELPRARFRRNDTARLAQWLKDLAEQGPAAEREVKSPLGLSAADFNKVRKDLAAPVGFATLGATRRQVVQKIAGGLTLPLKLDADLTRALADEKLEDDLIGLSRGTAIAYVLRLAGYSLAPQVVDGRTVYSALKADGNIVNANLDNIKLADFKAWPVGWTSDKPDRDAIPALYEFRNVNLESVAAATAIEAIGKRLRVPLLFDRKMLARHEIDTAKVKVTVPRSRTTYSLALRKLLFQARLKYEVRYDDAGSPFLWITTIKP